MFMKKIALIPNETRDFELTETKNIAEILKSFGAEVALEQKFCGRVSGVQFGDLRQILKSAEAAIVLGGDGTILGVAPQAAVYGVPLLGINLGNLGFLSQAERGDYSVFKQLFEGEYSVTSCMMLDAVKVSRGEEVRSYLALNDIVVTAGGGSRMINISAAINGTNLGSYSADGLIVASAVGSTAYSLSAGGAILHPDLDAMIITPICPHTLKARSTVVPASDEIWLSPAQPYRSEISILADGNQVDVLKNDEFIKVTKSKYRTRLIKPKDKNFFDVLREKLSD